MLVRSFHASTLSLVLIHAAGITKQHMFALLQQAFEQLVREEYELDTRYAVCANVYIFFQPTPHDQPGPTFQHVSKFGTGRRTAAERLLCAQGFSVASIVFGQSILRSVVSNVHALLLSFNCAAWTNSRLLQQEDRRLTDRTIRFCGLSCAGALISCIHPVVGFNPCGWHNQTTYVCVAPAGVRAARSRRVRIGYAVRCVCQCFV